jgi:hypothetical protein
MINENNIFDQGMLIHLKMGGYEGRMKLSVDQLKDLPQEIVRGVHDLFDKSFKDLLREIGSFDNETRWEVKRRSVPFPIDGVYFITSGYIEKIIELLEQRKIGRRELIAKAVENYDVAIQIFSEKYPDYFERAKHKYLTKDRFQQRFYFQYQFIKITAPDKNGKFITPEMYKLEMKKFKDTINEMKQEVLGTIYQSLLEVTGRLKKQCTDGKPNQRTFNSLNAFLAQIDDVYSDFIDRDDMKEAIKKIKAQVLGIDANDLRSSEDLKAKFGKEIAALGAEIKALPDIPLKRAIDF